MFFKITPGVYVETEPTHYKFKIHFPVYSGAVPFFIYGLHDVEGNIDNIPILKQQLADPKYREAFRFLKCDLPNEIQKIFDMMEILER